MTSNRGPTSNNKTRIVALAADAEFGEVARAAFGAVPGIELLVLDGRLAEHQENLGQGASLIVADFDPAEAREIAALARVMASIDQRTPVVAVMPSLNPDAARQLLQLRVADFLIKPVIPADLLRACVSALQAPASAERHDAQILTFLPAVGGAGVTTVAIQSALLLRELGTTCLVDLDFQHGACADYLDLEPRLDLTEVAPRPERLDRQLLEVMMSYHKSGLAVIAAPNRPAEMRVFDPELVTRLLDLVSTHFDCVVIDMPRTWFAWTDSVLLGSNKVFIVSEMTVPSVKQARQLAGAIRERLGESPHPRVIVNRFEQRMFGASLRRGDIEQALGAELAGVLPNDYALVREAIDRGVPLSDVKAKNKITAALKKLVLPPPARAAAREGGLSRLSLSWAK